MKAFHLVLRAADLGLLQINETAMPQETIARNKSGVWGVDVYADDEATALIVARDRIQKHLPLK